VNASDVPPIGERIRAERVRLGVTVRGLARDVGVSASLISQIETGRSQPSVSTLYAITTALDISIEDIFAPPAPPGAPVPAGLGPAGTSDVAGHADVSPGHHGSSDGQSIVTAAQLMRPDRNRRIGPVVHPDDREALTLDTGVVWELLGQVPGIHVDFLMVTYRPGGASSSSGTLMRHSGIEYGYLISGELMLTLGFDEHRLSAGDAISFDSTTPHGYRNEGTEPAVGVWFVLERLH
jgi:DNA-binding XRE family transcriptional regulator/quercetin dioxygenase-like cupin family protein